MGIRKQTPRPGNIYIMMAFSMMVLLGVLALSLDGGLLLNERRRAQTTADAAALAAACQLYEAYWTNSGTDQDGKARDSAFTTARANGYSNDGVESKVTVNIPPTSGPFVDRRGYVEVIVEYFHDRSFSSVFASGKIPVGARAVAVGTPVAADVGILVLDPVSRAALNSQGGGVSVVQGTPVIVNSSHREAAVAGGGGSLKANKFIVAGGYDTSGGGQFVGPIYSGRPGMEDPLKDIPVPDPTKMVKRATNKTQYTAGNIYLEPGVYKGGISVSGTGNLYLSPGIYYMEGGGFSFSGQGSLRGIGVMIYNAPGSGNSDGISVTGQGSMVLSGPTSGIYQGITFFQDRQSNVTGNIEGTGGETSITGTFYFAGAMLKVSGNGGVANLGSQYISRQLYLGGNGSINIDWRPNEVARKRSIFLVE